MNAVGNSEEGRVGKMVGIYNGTVRIGYVIGNFAGGLLFDMLGYRVVFLFMAACSLLGVIPAVFGIERRRRRRPLPGDSPLNSEQRDAASSGSTCSVKRCERVTANAVGRRAGEHSG